MLLHVNSNYQNFKTPYVIKERFKGYKKQTKKSNFVLHLSSVSRQVILQNLSYENEFDFHKVFVQLKMALK